jgi:hypothetical protein
MAALIINDRVKETSTTTGTVTFELAGASQGFETFVAGIGTGNKILLEEKKMYFVQFQLKKQCLQL